MNQKAPHITVRWVTVFLNTVSSVMKSQYGQDSCQHKELGDVRISGERLLGGRSSLFKVSEFDEAPSNSSRLCLYKTMLPIIAMPSKSRGGTCLGEVRRA